MFSGLCYDFHSQKEGELITENKQSLSLEDLKEVAGGTGDENEQKTYVVQAGDSLHSIAAAHGCTTVELALLNKDTIIKTAQAHGYYFDDPLQYANYIFEGEVLLLP